MDELILEAAARVVLSLEKTDKRAHADFLTVLHALKDSEEKIQALLVEKDRLAKAFIEESTALENQVTTLTEELHKQVATAVRPQGGGV